MAAEVTAFQQAAPIETRPMIDGEFEGKNLLSIDQFTREDVEQVLGLAGQMEAARASFEADRDQKIPQLLSGFLLKAIMFENSSRTADSYLSAAAYLGAKSLQPNIVTSAQSKGESPIEAVEVFAANADGFLVRHGSEGFMDEAAARVKTPFISGGSPGDHVTQTLKDLYTWQKLFNKIDGSRVVIAGHMAKYRAAISLLKGLSLFEGVDVTIAAPEFAKMPANIIEYARARGVKVTEAEDLRPLLREPGRFYFCRPPLEYCEEDEKNTILDAYEKNGYLASHNSMEDAHPEAYIFHPLPHNGEIADDFYTDRRAFYKEQEANGLYIHMACQALQLAQSRLDSTIFSHGAEKTRLAIA